MNIVVLNGSPKGPRSVTLQYVKYVTYTFPEHEYHIFHVAQQVPRLERDARALAEVTEAVETADGVVWAFPLYYLLVHGHYKRFIELIFEHEAHAAFQDKYCVSLSTSIHFYDHTAHNYVRGICADLGMRHVGAFAPEMFDLFHEGGRRQLETFARDFFSAIESRRPVLPDLAPAPRTGTPAARPCAVPEEAAGPVVDVGDLRVLILTDHEDDASPVGRMVARARQYFDGPVDVLNLHAIDIKGGCLGCVHCAMNNECAYAGKDEYQETLESRVLPADVVIWAGAIRDRFLSARWKVFIDRMFYRGHTPAFRDCQVGVLVSGPWRQRPNLQEVLRAYFEVQQAHLAGVVSDEGLDQGARADLGEVVDEQIAALVERLVRLARAGYQPPRTFRGFAGQKVFRDAMYGRYRFPFAADHAYYKAHDYYDFPKASCRTRFMAWLARFKFFRREAKRRMVSGMVTPFDRLLARLFPDRAAREK